MTFLYFDPGIGAMIVQGIVAAVAGIVLFSKSAMFKIKSFFGITKKEDDIFDDIHINQSKKDATESE